MRDSVLRRSTVRPDSPLLLFRERLLTGGRRWAFSLCSARKASHAVRACCCAVCFFLRLRLERRQMLGRFAAAVATAFS